MSSEAISCRRCTSPFEDGDLRCAVCGHAAPADVRDDLAEAIVEVLRCEGCGAAVSYSVTARAPQCAFCGSIVHLEHPEDPLEQAGLVRRGYARLRSPRSARSSGRPTGASSASTA